MPEIHLAGNLDDLLTAPGGPVHRALTDAAQRVVNAAKLLCPVDTGRLRNSIGMEIHGTGRGLTAVVGTNVEYACILGGHTGVVTSTGVRTIGQVRPGELVLTQSGDFRPVRAASRFPVTEKPDLVEIKVPWRAGREHVLTVTADHRVLVDRGGVKKWVQAGDLTGTDGIHLRRKIAHNEGTGRKITCAHCEAVFPACRADRFCSMACRDDYWRDHGHWMLGRDRGDAFREIQSASRKALYAAHPEKHPNRAGQRVTSHEVTLACWLALRDRPFQYGARVGRWWVDFLVEQESRIYEADGGYWHLDQAADIERDRALRELRPDLDIVHLHFRDRRSPTLDPNPLPGVYYVAVNPDPHSYVEPETYETRRPSSLRAYRYEYRGKPRGRVPWLYDLSVDGEHSFMANGLLVSNSAVHEGHGPIVPVNATVLTWQPRAGPRVFARRVGPVGGKPFLTDALRYARV